MLLQLYKHFFLSQQKYAQSVQISSKLVTRITQLPFMADPETISYQTQQVTTEVFPSEMGEGEIPWWVWLLAALLGLLLLAIITLCLYKVSTKFFVHSIFSSFGFWYFGHFSCVIVLTFFSVLPIWPCKM